MPLLLLLLLLLISLHKAWPNPLGLDPAASGLSTAAGVFLLALAWEGILHTTCWALRRDPVQRGAVMHRYARLRHWHGLFQIGFFLLALYGFGWGWTIQQAEDTWYLPGFKIAMLAPLVASMAFGWARQYDVERLNHEILCYPNTSLFVGRWAYFGLQARHHLLFVLPPMLLLIAHDSLLLAAVTFRADQSTLLMGLASIALLAIALMFIPVFLRLFLGLQSLPDGPIRQRLLQTARRLNFRFNDILIWNTRKGVANAMVTGILPRLRYVVVTDQLLHELSEDELEAVFGHEVGHMKHHHMSFYMIFILTSLMLLGGLWTASDDWFQRLEPPAWLANLVQPTTWHTVSVLMICLVVALYILVVFGWLSRRCERQADIFGCKTVSPAAFISALEKVADINGIPRERPGFMSWWQHSTIADRIGFIQRMEADPALEPKFQRRLGWTKWGLALGLIVLVVLLGNIWNWNMFALL